MHPTRYDLKGMLSVCFCLFALLLVACGGSPPSQQTATSAVKASAEKQIYIWPETGVADIATFDPALAVDGPSIRAIDMVFTGLVTLDSKLQAQDQLAASHSVSADGLTWTFKLRPNLKFSDGTSLTSSDVAYSLDRALDPALKSPTAPSYLGLIKDSDKRFAGKVKTIIGDSVLTPDPQTVVITLNKKASYFLQTLTYVSSYVVEKSMIEKYGNNFADHLSEGIGGAGPFKVSRYIHNQLIEFVPNPNYYGPQPLLKKVVFPFYQQIDTAFKTYQAGQLHYSPVPPAQVPQARTLPNGQYHQIPALAIYYVGMNYLVKPFDNIKIRQAFDLAIDKDAISHNVYKDSTIPTNHIVPSGMPGYYPDLVGPAGVKATKGDPNLAKQLLQEGMQEEGYTLSTFPSVTLTVTVSGISGTRAEFAVLQQMWQSVLGISVKINELDTNKLIEEIFAADNNAKGLQMWYIDWGADYPDPQDWLTLLFDKNVPNNNSNYGQNHLPNVDQQQQAQQWMEQADGIANQTDRMQQYNKAEQQLVNDVAWLPISQATRSFVRQPCVVGIADNAQGLIPPDSWGQIYMSTATPCADVSHYQ
ncbi:MAG TPA: peptide ABC transporter substrate-binding protein [Ktedonobacteraceae bacterium]|nr:peptide ABC transporter substrate-binding protein [Ktedonobacteraceae bacterium]